MTLVTSFIFSKRDNLAHGHPQPSRRTIGHSSNSANFFRDVIDRRKAQPASERSANLFIEVLYHYRLERKYLLHSFVVMPDHFHLLITVGHEITIERAVQFIKGGFAFRAGKQFGFRPPVWQRGFSEGRIYDPEHLGCVQEYIAQNPVKRRLVLSATEYAYSSAFGRFELDEVPQGLKPLKLPAPGRHA